jgi:hypothetical protein
MNNDPTLTNVTVRAYSDNYGAGYTGWIQSGCCPVLNPNCHIPFPGSGSGSNSFAFAFADPANPLPIKLMEFSAEVKKRKVYLSWVSATEVNNDYYSLLRSEDGKEWNEIARIKGAGNSTEERYYNYTDEPEKEGVWYYRLKQTDFDGQFSFSEIKEVHIKLKALLKVFPNPAADFITIELDESKDFRISIYNTLGERIVVPVMYQDSRAVLSTTLLPSGLYFFDVISNGEQESKGKFLIQIN